MRSLSPRARELRSHLTYANVMATIAVFMAMGGGAYALSLPRNSVGAKQLRKNAVTTSKIGKGAVISSKVKDRSLLAKDFKAGQLRAGPRGATGLQGPPGPFPDPLGSGKTLRGFWGHISTATAGGQADNLFYSYGGFRLASAPIPHYIPSGQAAPAGCTGGTFADPTADPGHLCVYEKDRVNTSAQPSVCAIDECPGSDDNGFQVALSSAAAGLVTARGSWAVTAP